MNTITATPMEAPMPVEPMPTPAAIAADRPVTWEVLMLAPTSILLASAAILAGCTTPGTNVSGPFNVVPAPDAPAFTAQQKAAQEELVKEKPQILLVDDSEMNRLILAEILQGDYRILEAKDGRECMDALQAEAGNLALVLLDINMPVMDGFEVLKAMNANQIGRAHV